MSNLVKSDHRIRQEKKTGRETTDRKTDRYRWTDRETDRFLF